MDNVFIERLWRSLRYEEVYLKGNADGREARAGIGSFLQLPPASPGSGWACALLPSKRGDGVDAPKRWNGRGLGDP